MTKFTADEEKLARVVAVARGANPDAPITIGNPDGSVETFDTAWHGYVPLVRLLEQARDPNQPDPPMAVEVVEQPVPPPPPPSEAANKKRLLTAPPK